MEWIRRLDLPSLCMLDGRLNALRNVTEVELVNIPYLTSCVFVGAFKRVAKLTMEGASKLEETPELREVKARQEREEAERRAAEEASKHQFLLTQNHPLTLPNNTIGVFIVSNGCKRWSLGSFDLSGVTYLKELRIGDECFNSVNEFKLIGLKYLETMMIGKKSFSISEKGKDYNRRFYVKNCPRLKTLNIGYRSFSDYKVIEIESVDVLESLRIGDNSRYSNNFYWASLELRSVFDVMK